MLIGGTNYPDSKESFEKMINFLKKKMYKSNKKLVQWNLLINQIKVCKTVWTQEQTLTSSKNKAEHAVQSKTVGKGFIVLLSNAKQC